MTHFEFKRSTTRQAIELAAAWFVGIAVFGGIAFYLINTGGPHWFAWGLLIGLAPFTLGMLLPTFAIWRRQSHWHVVVTDDRVVWNAPREGMIVEESFHVAIASISRLTIEIDPADTTPLHIYTLRMADGASHVLGHNSGIDLHQFASTLSELGIPIEQTVNKL